MNNENNPIDPNVAQPPRRRRVPRRDGKVPMLPQIKMLLPINH